MVSPNVVSPNGGSPNGVSLNGVSPNGGRPNGVSPSPNGVSLNGGCPRTSLVINKFSSKVAQDHATYLPGLVCKYVFGLTPLIFR